MRLRLYRAFASMTNAKMDKYVTDYFYAFSAKKYTCQTGTNSNPFDRCNFLLLDYFQM